MKTIFFILLIFASQLIWAKELYLTVRRDFSPTEEAVVELIYRNKAPISIRLLKPTDMKEFIASQIDLRRSWKEPKVVVNTAKYLVRGVNQSKLDLDWIRSGANAELRKNVFSQFKELSGGQFINDAGSFSEGPLKLIQKPEKFKLIKDFVFYPMEEEKNKDFDIPGFNWWFHDSSDGVYKTKFLKLPQLESGFYVVQVVQGDLEGQVIVVSNDLMGYMQQMEDTVLLRTSDRNGKPLKNVNVSLRDLNGEWVKETSSEDHGEILIEDVDQKELVVLLEKEGKGAAIIDSEFFSTQAVFPDLYLYTDRPMYKPGDNFSFKGILRNQDEGRSLITGKGASVSVSVVDTSDSEIIAAQTMEVNQYGSFSGTFTLPENANGGIYRLNAKVLDDTHIGEFRIKDYVKPVMWAKIKTLKETLHAGDTLSADLEVGRYSGGVPDEVEYKVELYRTRFSVPQFVEDAGMGETNNNQYGFDDSETVSTNIPLLVLSQDYKALKGQGLGKISLNIPKDLPGSPNFDYSFLLKITIKDSDGNFANVAKTFMDLKSEHMVQAKFTAVYITSGEPSKLLTKAIYPSGASYGKASGKVTFKIQEYDKPSEIIKEQAFTTNDNGVFEILVPGDRVGKMMAIIEMSDRKGAKNSTTVEALVIGDGKADRIAKVDEMEIYLRKTSFSPREESKALLLLPEKWGMDGKNEGFIYVTVAGRNYYDRQVLPVKGQVAWINQTILSRFGTAVYLIVSYPHPIRGWLERKISYRILQDDKLMKISIKPKLPELSPGTEQTLSFEVKDHEGNPTQGEIAVAVVDEAVLALQPEMRPRLMDFFYPLDRLNAMSFLSTHFQAYGYGEKLASLFAPGQKYLTTNKLPDPLKEEDTAYWNGHIETDSNGKATVSFRMPANLTKWRVIASVIDQSGRFGEGNGEFASEKKIEFNFISPSFLRVGDEVLTRLMLSNIKDKSKNVNYVLSTKGSLILDANQKGDFTLPPNKDITQSILIKTSSPLRTQETIPLQLALKYDYEEAQFPYDMKIRPGVELFPMLVKQVERNSTFTLGKDESVSNAKILMATGLSGTIAPALAWLVQYPHGCIEQLVNSTMPNLAIAEVYKALKEINMRSKNEALVKKDFTAISFKDKILKSFRTAQFKIKYDIIPPSPGVKLASSFEKVLERAKSFGESGVAKINGSMNPSGDFSWFSDSGSADQSMSMHVLLSLMMVNDQNLVKNISLRKIFNNLRTTIPYTERTEQIFLTFAASRLYSWSDPTVETKDAALPAIKLQATNLLKDGSILEMSYLLLAMKNYGYVDEGGIKKEISELKSRIENAVNEVIKSKEFKIDRWFPRHFHTGTKYYRHLGKESSALALAANALASWGMNSSSDASKIAGHLMKYFEGDSYGSTYETAHTLLNSVWIFQREAKDHKEGFPFNVKINGSEVDDKDLKVVEAPLGWEVHLESKKFREGNNEIKVDGGPKASYIKVSLQKEVPLMQVKKADQNWSLSREYYKLNEKTGAAQLLETKDHLMVGDLVYVKLKFNAEASKLPWWTTQYLLLSDDIPPTFQVIEEDHSFEAAPYSLPLRQTRYASRSINANQLLWYIDRQDNKIHDGVIGYVARVSFAGSFQSGVAKVSDFYDENNFSHTGSLRFVVDALK
jgi:hypothetical protein